MKLYEKGEPHVIDADTGDTLYLCQCGQTQNPPYCDGSHKGTDKTPYEFKSEEKQQLYICGCGKSANLPFCDGSHNN